MAFALLLVGLSILRYLQISRGLSTFILVIEGMVRCPPPGAMLTAHFSHTPSFLFRLLPVSLGSSTRVHHRSAQEAWELLSGADYHTVLVRHIRVRALG